MKEIKKIVETERQITRSKQTELSCHMTGLLGRPSLTLKPHDHYLLLSDSRGNCGKDNKTDKVSNFFISSGFQFRFRIIYIKVSVKVTGYRLKE